MTDLKKAAQQALEALVKSTGELHRYYSSPTDMQILLNHKAITALCTALEQPEQELVAVHQWREQGCADWYDGHPDYCDGGGPYETRTLYTTPPQRPWVGLTDEEVSELSLSRRYLVREVEAKLKERNT